MRLHRFTFLLPFFLLLFGCSSLTSQRVSQSFDRPQKCQEFFAELDKKVKETGMRDASSFPIPGFPYLRANRFLSALKENLKDDRQREDWVLLMREVGLKARKKEISNVGGSESDRDLLLSRLESCSLELFNHDTGRPDFYSLLESLVDVPDEYSSILRTVGVYPVIALPVAVVTENSRKKIKRRFDVNLNDLPVDGRLRTFVPGEGISPHEKELRKIIEESRENPLKVPLPDLIQEKTLVQAFAPIFIQDVAAPYDQPGQVVWRNRRIEVDSEKPTVYYYLSHAFLKGKPTLQINYAIWYSERAGERPPSIEKGHLDGLTVRISLDGQGRVFMVEAMNNCGCYHLFAPDRERVDRILSRPLMFDAMVPQWLPEISTGDRLGIRINSGWHQVQRLISMKETSDSVSYQLVPYDILEALSHKDGRTESIFNERGIAKGSERVERFLLFSMGIPSVGSMRQRGHHAIELIGRVHFDDPFLFDQNFIFK